MLAGALDVLEASLVSRSISACLVESGRHDLILCKGRVLEIYRIDPVTEVKIRSYNLQLSFSYIESITV